ncbi:MAG TPA: translation initiation factor IF-2 [Thermoanaerobacterales bacterium]|nr:translation initiation factor IF-2 [Thermoanaerobacterales bacterium]
MSRVRIYQLAKELGLSNKKLLEILKDLNIEVKNHMSTIETETANLICEMITEEGTRTKENGKKPKNTSNKSPKKKVDMPETNIQVEGDKKELILSETITIRDLAKKLNVEPSWVIKELIEQGIIVNINQKVKREQAEKVARKLGYTVAEEEAAYKETEVESETKNKLVKEQVRESSLKSRPPIVTVMGHVDHGKTSLLDTIRKSNVTASEAGGITQHIGAYQVIIDDEKIVFLDTPGHEAFTELRSRGAKVTDIAVLVVAADDGVMPQTIEAINHAKAANIPIIVAINKIDKPNANPERIKQQLAEQGLIPEDWGGDTICVLVSAKNRTGIDELLEMIILVAEMSELKAEYDAPAVGTIIEAKLDKGRGPVATLIVQKGTLHVGDSIVAGTSYGKVRAMIDDRGNRIEKAFPSTPVEVLGLSDVPNAGDLLYTVEDDKLARQIAEKRKVKQKEHEFKMMSQRVTLDKLFQQIKEGEVKELNLIIKGDVQGSVEALVHSIEKLDTDEIKIKVIHGAVGSITESDVMLASASNAIIIGFNVRPEPNANKLAEKEKVDIRVYRVIYEALEDIESAVKGMLEPIYREVVIGRADVRATFKVPNVGIVAGCYVSDGKVTRNSLIRVLRDGVIVYEGKIGSLKRFKDDVKEVSEGYECGISIEKFNDIKEGDVFEAFIMEEVDR